AKRAKAALKDALKGLSSRPLVRAYHDLNRDLARAPQTAGRVVNVMMASPERQARRLGLAVRAEAQALAKRWVGPPTKIIAKAAGELVGKSVLEHVPIVRDREAAAALFGMGLETRLNAALRQFRSALAHVRGEGPGGRKLRRIEVSAFGADRGSVIARLFLHRLVETHTDKDGQLRVDGVELRLPFLGLFDAKSSYVDGTTDFLLSLLPLPLDVGDGGRVLHVPAAVRRCVHLGAAHELRAYQRWDSLRHPNLEERLYPGTSDDVCGGVPDSSLGTHATLMRLPLRYMLEEAGAAGVEVMQMEEMKRKNDAAFKKFTLADPVTWRDRRFSVKALVAAYDAMTNGATTDFAVHMEVFLRWLGHRCNDPLFRTGLQGAGEEILAETEQAEKARREWEAKFRYEQQSRGVDPLNLDRQSPEVQAYFADLKKKMQASRPYFEDRKSALGRYLHYTGLFERLEREAGEVEAHPRPEFAPLPPGVSVGDKKRITFTAPQTVEQRLAHAWREGLAGRHGLSDDVLALFDLLVHDTTLGSWEDHVLQGRLYFRVREVDVREGDDVAEANGDAVAHA
ncbi:MAG TPA: hypothetical protein VGM71_11355, partial [Luteibacter sp.]